MPFTSISIPKFTGLTSQSIQTVDLLKMHGTKMDNEIPRVFPKDIKNIREELQPEFVMEPVFITVVAIHNNPVKNQEVKLACQRSLPMEGYRYAAVNDKYTVVCFDNMPLGFINISYFITMNGTGGWRLRVPMPEAVVKRYLSADQRRKLANYKATFRNAGEDVRFEYVQMVSASSNG
jgi:hypothetical protein